MSPSVVCRGCGRRLKLPPGFAGKKARCPKCGAKFDPSAGNAESTLYVPNLANEPVAPEPPSSQPEPAPKPEPLSLDDAEQVLSLDDAEPTNGPPSAAAPVLPPPFRFAVEVVADSLRKLRGAFAVVLTPHGLFLESVPARPFLFAPIGTKTESAARDLTLTLPDRVLTLRFGGVANPRLLVADTAAFLAGTRPVPDPNDYRRPWWLLGLGAVLALALAAVPVALTQTSDLRLGLGLLLGGLFAGVALAANAGIVLLSPLPTGGKVGAMAGVCVAVMAVFLVVLGLSSPTEQQPPAANNAGTTPETPTAPTPPGATPQPAEPEPQPNRPPTHMDHAAKNGMSRLDDGPAEVTALALAPRDETVVIGYADGQTRLWLSDQPTFEPPPPGPRADGPIRRIQFDTTGRFLYLTCPGALIAAPRDGRNKALVKIPGDPIAVFTESNRDRFLAVRGGRGVLRLVPTELVRNPPPARAVKGFVISASGPKGDEVFPAGVKGDYTLPGPLTFLAWHPMGKILAGQMDGTIVSWPLAAPKPETVTRVHKAPVRTWATAAGTWDFATGDDNGLIAVWPNKSLNPRTFGDGAAAITHLAFDSWGLRLAVADADGELWVWDAVARELLFRVRRPAPVKALAFGPTDDFLLIGDGKGVEVWSVEALAKK